MTPFLKLIRNTVHKLFGVFYEGPEAPTRLEQAVSLFMRSYPKATRIEWAAFATNLANNSYQEGYLRGYEWAERDLDSMPKDSPEVEEEHQRHALVWDGVQLLKDFDELDEVVMDDDGDTASIEDSIDAYTQAFDQYRATQHPGKRYSR